MKLKDIAISFLELVASGEVEEAYQKYVGQEFSHHNPYFAGDAQSLMNGMKESAAINPNKRFEIKRAIEEGELVAVHSHVRQNTKDIGAAVVHIFRFQNERIVELWDVGQAIPEESLNKNCVF